MVPTHVDNGLFLLVTPSPESPLVVFQSEGSPVSPSSSLPPDSLLVLFGRGLTEWLLQDLPSERRDFWAAAHAVPALEAGVDERAIFARMKVAPGKNIDSFFAFLLFST